MTLPPLISDAAYSTYEHQLEKEVKAGEMPGHIAVIMDGNRRYAEEVLKAEPMEGHRIGRERLEDMLHWCLSLNIRVLTVFAFSTENFNRDHEEVDYLMSLLEKSLYDFADDSDVHRYKVTIRVIGDMDMLPDNVRRAADYAFEKTGDYSDYVLNMAIAYGGRQDITNAVRSIAKDVKEGRLDIEDISEDAVSKRISTCGIPDPDLVLRTSGEIRISNFLLWQMAYSELYFSDVYWPGFRYIDLLRAIRTYQQRRRRYGR